MAETPSACDVCQRKPGTTKGRCGEKTDSRLGPLERCPLCKLFACPDCLHEAECCFIDEDAHMDNPTWAPPGWTRTSPEEYRRIEETAP